ncbi:phosphonatase-like hydrolase [Corynebacterium suedekumii]|uniref:Phosphonatase-like hydrolase n=1 Tax=Corynebacterium suedekumii TaxID=3049801 RepID=A0ABY8VMS0_9CORY|nr:phosphonatase-like hydrolase [Corynebacterium suedekumii]WIM70281.1 phosphonatase-like hydrolase [Corynebacterium suedekumii]
MFTLAVFDMAGTTINDRDEVYRVLREATEREGARYSDDQFQEWMGTEKKWAIRNLLEIGGVEPGEELVEKAWEWFRAELRRAYTENPPVPLDGVEEALRTLRADGVKVGLTTGFSREIADLIFSAMGWRIGDQFDTTATGDEVAAGRPEPFMIQQVMATTGVTDPAQVVSVGDTASDVVSAQRAGVISVGVLTGHLDRGDFERLGADRVLDSAADLPTLLAGAH